MPQKGPRVFFRRSQKVVIPTHQSQIVIPFKPISLLIILVLLGLTLFLALRSDLFLVRKVEVLGLEGNECLKEEEFKEKLDVFGRSIILLDLKKRQKALEEDYICLASVSLGKKFPDKISAQIKEKKPLAILVQGKFNNIKEATFEAKPATASANEDSNKEDEDNKNKDEENNEKKEKRKFFVLDEKGIAYKEQEATSSSIPSIYSNLSVRLGKDIDNSRLNKIIELLNLLKEKNSLPIRVFGGEDDFYTMFFKEGFWVNVLYDSQAPKIVDSLQQIQDEVKIKGKKLEGLDLRFEKPIATFQTE